MRHSTLFVSRLWLVWLVLAFLALVMLACGFEGGAFGSTPTPSSKLVIPTAASLAGAAPTPQATPAEKVTKPVEQLLITAPQPGLGVQGTLHIEGLSDPALAQQLNVVVCDALGTVIAMVRPVVSAQSNQRSAFSVDVALSPAMPPQAGRVQVYSGAPNFTNVVHLSSVEVQLNGVAQPAVPIDPQSPEAIAISAPSPGATVKGTVHVSAAVMMGNRIIVEVQDARNQIVGRVEQSAAPAAGVPAQVLVEVPVQVWVAGPGRVLVYALNAVNGATEHLSSVEVNLMP